MKQYTLTLLLAMAFASPSLHAQVPNADTMVHRLFTTFKNNDEKGFVALYPDRDQFGRFMRSLMEQTMNSDAVKKEMAADESTKNLNIDSLVSAQVSAMTSPEAFGQMKISFGKLFRKTVEKGEEKGVRWADAKIVSYTLDSAANLAEGAPFELSGMKAGKGVIDFTAGGTPYQLVFEKIFYLEKEGGWFGGEFPQVVRKGESLAPAGSHNNGDDGRAKTNASEPSSKAKAPAAKRKVNAGARKKA